MKHKYFKDLKKVPYPYSEKDYPEIDERDTWNMDSYIIASLYGHLKKYKDACKDFVNLEYHKFHVNGEELTQLQCIDKMIDNLKFILDSSDNVPNSILDSKEQFEQENKRMRETFDILKEVFWAMWW